jgi:pectate lyase
LRLWLYGYNDHDNLDHGYIMIGYLDIDIKNTVYRNSRTPFNSIHVVTCFHATPAVTAGGKRGETRKAPEVPTH